MRRVDLGFPLNTTLPLKHTPGCGATSPVEVFEKAVRWRCCGHIAELAPLHQGRDFGCRFCADRRGQEVAA